MVKLFGRLFGGLGKRRDKRSGGLDSAIQALGEGEAARPQPTLVCRQCGVKYVNTGTYLQGSRCPDCHPDG